MSHAVAVHAFKSITEKTEEEDLCEFEDSLTYRITFRTNRYTEKLNLEKQQQSNHNDIMCSYKF